ncbi:galactose-3-O-sulfotransferase 2-like isoform X2 [Ptychodera flava]|uniref:galactose-3-O-sulfotransferase 2-like isoform X2 n=1 Tax=Ptychodera flava TaxID=63121 RepID=UPI00396A8F75
MDDDSNPRWLANKRVLAVSSTVIIFYVWYQLLVFERYYESHIHMRLLPGNPSRQLVVPTQNSGEYTAPRWQDDNDALHIEGKDTSSVIETPMNESTRNIDIMTSQSNISVITLYAGDGKPPLCQRKNNVMFLKTRNTASDTVSRLFMRFGDINELNVALPVYDDYEFSHSNLMQSMLFLKPPPPGERFNLFFLHTVYNKTLFNEIMEPDIKYVTIVGQPLSQLHSTLQFFNVNTSLNISDTSPLLNTFLTKPENIGVQNQFPNLKNFMLSDLGLPKSEQDDMKAVRSYIDDLDRDFDLVMVSEYFDESLVLLKRMLCWSLRDILYIDLDAMKRKIRPVNSATDEDIHRNFSPADYKLYNYFNKTLWRKVSQEVNFEKEVEYFREINARFVDFCDKANLQKSFFEVEPSIWSNGFSVDTNFCTNSRISFMDYIHILKKKVAYISRRRSRKAKL